MANLSANVTSERICTLDPMFINTGISLIGIPLNALCALTFWHIIRESRNEPGNMFRYLLHKSAIDSAKFVIIAFDPVFHCKNCTISKQYATQLSFVIFFIYLSSALEFASG